MEWTMPSRLFILLLSIQAASALENDSTQVLSFTFEEFDQQQNQWKSTTDIERGKNIRLLCTLDRNFSDTFNIKKLATEKTLGTLKHPNNRQVVLEFESLICDQFGVYVCEDGKGTNKTIDMGVFGCAPRLLNENETTTRVIPVPLNESVSLIISVSGYPEIAVDFPKTTYDSEVDSRHTRKIPFPPSKADIWTYNEDSDPNIFGVYQVNISKPSITQSDYGEHKIAIFTIHEGVKNVLNYTVVLEPSELGPPECPTALKVINQEAESLTLSWKPGFDGGSTQFFLVYKLLNDGGQWSLTGKATEDNHLRLTGLQADTAYSFKVIPHNRKVSRLPDASMCHDMVDGRTAKLGSKNAGARDTDPNVTIIAVSVVIGLIVVIVAAVITGCVLLYKHKRSKTYERVDLARRAEDVVE